MPTFTTVDANWDTGVTLDAAELRRGDTAMFLGDGSVNGVRGGIVRHGDNSLAVTVNGSDQVTVQAGAFVIPAATGLGVYRGAFSAAVGPSAGTALSARNGTNPRIDLIVIQMTGTNATLKTIDGTPGSSPSAPALPAQHIELARVTVPQVGGGAVTVDSSFRSYAAALGGTLLVETANRLPGSGNQKGQRAIALDTGLEHVWNGTTWAATARNAAVTGNVNATQSSQAYIDGRTVTVYLNMTVSAALTPGLVVGALPASDYFPPTGRIAYGKCFNINTLADVLIRIDSDGTIRNVAAATAGTQVVGTITYVN